MSGRDELAARRAKLSGHPSAQDPRAVHEATSLCATVHDPPGLGPYDGLREPARYLDTVTGALLRDIGTTWLAREVARADRDGSLLMLGRLRVGGSCGDSGVPPLIDEMLRVFGQGVLRVLRSYDVFVRYGERDFVVALPGAQRSDALGKFDELSAEVSARSPGALVSVGLATLQPGEQLRDVLRRAELDRSVGSGSPAEDVDWADGDRPDGRRSPGVAWRGALLHQSFAGRRSGRWEPSTAQVGSARRLVYEALTEWERHDLLDSAAVIVSELVTNAIEHARTEFTVTVELLHGAVLLTVTDESETLPLMRLPDAMDGGGRGLRLVETLTSEWGVIADRQGGKTVWALLGT